MNSESNRYVNMLICIGKKKNPAYTSSSLCVRLAEWVQQRKSGFYTNNLFSWQIKSSTSADLFIAKTGWEFFICVLVFCFCFLGFFFLDY